MCPNTRTVDDVPNRVVSRNHSRIRRAPTRPATCYVFGMSNTTAARTYNRDLWIRLTEEQIASMCVGAEWGNDSDSEMECHAELQALVDEWFVANGR